MTTEEVISILERPSALKAELREKLEKARQLEGVATKTTASLTGMPGGGGTDRDGKLVDAAEASLDYETVFEEYRKAQEEATQFINNTTLNSMSKYILFFRFVMECSWPKVRAGIRTHCGETLSCRQMYRIRNEAIQLIAEESRHG